MKKTSIVLLALAALSLAACNVKLEKLKAPAALVSNGTLSAESVDFADVKTKVLGPRCFQCHSAANPAKGIDLETYSSFIGWIDDVRSDVISGRMPKAGSPPLNSAQKDLIINWIDAGAPEVAGAVTPKPQPSPSPTVDPTPVPVPTPSPTPIVPEQLDYASVNRAVIDPACLKCHSAAAHRGDVVLENYQDVVANLTDVQSDVEDGSMPKRSTLTADQKSLILNWIAAGAPEVVGGPPASAQPAPTPSPSPAPSPVPQPAPQPSAPPTIPTAALDYQTVKAQVFDQACMMCHSTATHKGGVVLGTYQGILDNLKDVQSDIEDGSMPKKLTLTAEQRNLVLGWIAIGAPEKAATPAAPTP